MSEDHPEAQTLPASNPKSSSSNCSLHEDNQNLFASVWVKIEENDDDEIQTRNEELTKLKLRKRRKPYKKRNTKPQLRNLKCDQCDYKTSYKNCLAIHILGHSDSKPFTCSQCDYKTRYPVSLKRHIIVKHRHEKEELPVYKCSICLYKTCFKWNLGSHQRKHDLEKQFKCPQCNYSTAYKHNIVKHSHTHKKPEESTYFCDKCPFSTKHEGHIARHLAKIHFEVSVMANRCEHCTFSTKTGWRLNLHKKRSRQHSPVKCAHCEYQSIYRCAFKEHKLTHTESNQHSQQWLDSLFTGDSLKIQDVQNKTDSALEIMQMCERSKIDVRISQHESENIFNELKSKLNDPSYYTFNNNEQSSQIVPNVSQPSDHERKNHYLVDPSCEVAWGNIQVIESPNQDRPFQCITCSYTAKFKASVQRHYQRHHTSQNRPYKCVNCDFCTKTKDQIALHNKRSKSDEILSCKVCGFTSVFKCQFLMHEKEHYPFKCVSCPFRCKKKPDMQKHFSIVHLGNGLKCSHCDFQAIKKESLLSHEAIHTGKKPFQCQVCEYTSVRRSLLEKHIHRFHQTKIVQKVIDDSKIESLKKKSVQERSENVVGSEDKDKIENYFYASTVPV